MFNIIINVKNAHVARLAEFRMQLKDYFPDSEVVAYIVDEQIWLTQENMPQQTFSIGDLASYCDSQYDFIFVDSDVLMNSKLVNILYESTIDSSQVLVKFTTKLKTTKPYFDGYNLSNNYTGQDLVFFGIFKLSNNQLDNCSTCDITDIPGILNNLFTNNCSPEVVNIHEG